MIPKSLPLDLDPRVVSGFRTRSCAQKREAETPVDADPYPPHPAVRLCLRLGKQLACRRSTAVLAKGTFVPKAQRQAMFPATWPERLVRKARPNRGAETSRRSAGVTRSFLSQSSDAPRAPVVVPADMMPKPPGSGGDEPLPAGTALAPSAGVTRPTSLGGQDSLNVIETETNVKRWSPLA